MLVGEIGEEKLLEQISRIFAATSGSVPVPIGDDGAVIECAAGLQQVWTADLLAEGIHFQSNWQSPHQLGRKCLAVNLSDLAAMGSKPATALVSLAFKKDIPMDEITSICGGICEMALEYGVAVAGGDLCASRDRMMISIAAGGTVSKGEAVLRSGASPGDTIYITGNLGSAAAGLRLLEEEDSKATDGDEFQKTFLDPVPRCEAGIKMAAAGATSMTDVSDGLATDLRHICRASGTGARIVLEELPRKEALKETAIAHGWDERELLLAGGEDYELLFTADEEKCGDAIRSYSSESGLKITAIGIVSAAREGLTMLLADDESVPLPSGGYDHFQTGRSGLNLSGGSND